MYYDPTGRGRTDLASRDRPVCTVVAIKRHHRQIPLLVAPLPTKKEEGTVELFLE